MSKNTKLISKAANKQKAGRNKEAQSLFKKILSTDPQHLDANYLIGSSYAEEGSYEQALKYLHKAESISNTSPFVKNNIGNVYRLTGEFDKAAQYYQQAIALNPDMAEAYNNLAVVQRRLGHDDMAINSYQSALSLNPGFIEAAYNLSKLYWDGNDYENNYACLQRVLDMDAKFPPALHDLGMYYFQQKANDEAKDYFNQYLQVSPDDPYGARLKLAYLSDGQLPEKHPAELVRQTYEKKAATWDHDVENPAMEFQGPMHVKKIFEKYYKDSSALTILDLGCGTGLCGEFLKEKSKLLHGVDLSVHMINQAKQKSIYDEIYNSDIQSFMVSTSFRYDLVTASGVFIFFGDLEKILMAVKNVLAEKGCLIATFYQSNKDDVTVRDNIHFAHSEKHITESAAKAGLSVVEITPIIHEYENGHPQHGFITVFGRQG